MNTIREIQALNKRELETGVSTEASWHADYRDTAYIYIGGLPFDLSEGDVITIFSQFGEPVHVNLVRDKDTGKSKGFAFLKYEDQRSTDLAVDNLGGANVMGRILKVDHTRYKRKDTEDIRDNAKSLDEPGGDGESDQSQAGGSRNKGLSRDIVDARHGRSAVTVDKDGMSMDDWDEDDPMKEYLARQRAEDIQNGLGKLQKEKRRTHEGGSSRHHHQHHRRRHRRDSEKDGDRRVRQEDHVHQPKSRDRSEDANRESFRRRKEEHNHNPSSSGRRRE